MTHAAKAHLNPAALALQTAQFALVGMHVKSLHDSRASGFISHRFKRSVYARFGSTLICIGLNEIGGANTTALLANSEKQLPVGLVEHTRIQFCEKGLLVNRGGLIELDGASVYKSPMFESFHIDSTALELTFLSNGLVSTDGFTPLLNNGVALGLQNEHLLGHVKPAIKALLIQVQGYDSDKDGQTGTRIFNVSRYRTLFGAGPGLTPSGDDFIAGVLNALHVTGRAKIAVALWQESEPVARAVTNPISFALLEQAAKGELGQHLSSVVLALQKYSSQRSGAAHSSIVEYEKVQASDCFGQRLCRQLSKVGHTSGWDWFTGFILCLRALDKHYPVTKPAALALANKSQSDLYQNTD